jgi:ribonuclease HI
VWLLSVDGSSNLKGSGTSVVLEGANDLLIEKSLRFEFKASNNQAEYEALIAGMTLAREMCVENLRAKSDSQLVTSQIIGEYQMKDTQLIKYLTKVHNLAERFSFFEAIYVPREQNSRADILAKLASNTVIQEVIASPSTEIKEVNSIIEDKESWMTPLLKYLTGSFAPKNEEEEQMVRKRASKFTIVSGKLYEMGRETPTL